MSLPPHFGVNFTQTLHNDINPSTDPRKSDLSQPGKVILITGAGRGIGRSIALQYAQAGVATVIICARTASELDEVQTSIHSIQSTISVRKIHLDITNEEQVLAAAESVRREEGRLDVLINNAGYTSLWVLLAEGDTDKYWNTWVVNIKGTYLMLHSFLPLMVETAKICGRAVDVVNVGSMGAHATTPGASAYQASKLALLRLGEFVVEEYSGKGVNCFSVHPGGVVNEFSKDVEQLEGRKFFCLDMIRLPSDFGTW